MWLTIKTVVYCLLLWEDDVILLLQWLSIESVFTSLCFWLTELAATAADANCGHGFISLSCNTMKTTRLCQRWLSIHLYNLKRVLNLNYHVTQVFIKIKVTPMFLCNSASLRRVSCVCVWSALLLVFLSYRSFCPLTYGIPELSANQLQRLKWKESWDILFRRH